MPYPGTRQNRTLGDDAKRVSDEHGKAQEVLRTMSARIDAPADGAVPNRETLGIPDVDILVVDILITAEGSNNCDIDVVAPVAWDTAPGATNELIATVDSSAADIADDTVSRRTLSGLNGNVVVAGQPILIVATDDTVGAPTGQFYVQLSYVLDDDERSF